MMTFSLYILSQENDSPSWFNPHEAWQVVVYISRLVNSGLTEEDIGVVAPYKKQIQKVSSVQCTLSTFFALCQEF